MPDQINPIAAEFGESSGIPAPPIPTPNKVVQDANQSDSFKKAMEEKARRVNEKDREEQRSQANEEHQLDILKPIDLEIKETREDNRPGSILDIQKTSSKSTKPIPSSDKVPEKTSITSSASDTSSDLSQGQDNLTQRLPDAPQSISKDKTVGETLVKKQEAPLPLTTAKEPQTIAPTSEKKIVTETSMESSSGQKDFSGQKTPAPIQTPIEEKQIEKKPITPFSPKAEPSPAPAHTTKPSIETPTHVSSVKAEEPPKIGMVEKPILPNKAEEKTPLLEKPQTKEPDFIPEPKPTPLQSKDTQAIEETLLQPTEKPSETLPIDKPSQDMSTVVTPFELPLPIDTQKKEIQVSKTDKEQEAESTKISAPPESDLLQDEKKDDDQHNPQSQSSQLLDTLFPSPSESPNVEFHEAIGFDRLPAHVLDLLDRICHVVTVMQIQGKTETTLHLGKELHQDLQGAEVVITNYATASNSYNIELRGPPEAVQMFQQNIDRLKKSFSSRKEEFKFEINEIRISLKEDKQGKKNP